jgi:hypothetical protein
VRVIVSGSRTAPQSLQAVIHARLAQLPAGTVVVYGAHWEGVDFFVELVLLSLPHLVSEPHPAKWHELRKQAGPIRNSEMVDLGADLAITYWDGRSTGTLDLGRKADRAKILLEPYDELGHPATAMLEAIKSKPRRR